VVVIVGEIAGGVVLDLARRVRERIPDRAAAAVLVHRALDLVGRGGGAPHEVFRKARLPGALGCCLRGGVHRCGGEAERGEARQLRKMAARKFSEHRQLHQRSSI
jgi:hypothetical protein